MSIAPLVIGGGLAGLGLGSQLGNAGDKGEGASKAALEYLARINPPTAEELAYELDRLVMAGELTPELARTIKQDPSQLQNLTYNTQGQTAQLRALEALQEIADSGGMTIEDKAALSEIQGRTGAAARGSREAISQNARERGVSGSGLELAAQYMNDQAASGQANQAGLDVAAQSRQRALDAIMAGGQMGAQFEGQQFGEAAKVAEAQDAINKFNAQNSQSVENLNIEAKNAAAEKNLAERQRISDTNTGLSNQEKAIAANAKQQEFENKMNKASGVAGRYDKLAEGTRASQAADTAFNSALISTGGRILAEDPNDKKLLSDETKKIGISDVPRENIDEFLASISPKKFRYKDPRAPGASGGESVGVMAQDLEKSELGKTMVKDGPGGKTIDVKKALSVLLAVISEMGGDLGAGSEA